MAIDGLVQRAVRTIAEFRTGQFPARRLPAPSPQTAPALDFRDVAGHDMAKRALQVAAAGRHGVLMTGPPGSGKTMLASRLPSILPPLEEDEALETALVHSVAGEDGGRPARRRATVSQPAPLGETAGLVGGGTPPRPGEVSLAQQRRAVPRRAAGVPARRCCRASANRWSRAASPSRAPTATCRSPRASCWWRRRTRARAATSATTRSLHVHAGPDAALPQPHRRAAHGPHRPACRRAPLPPRDVLGTGGARRRRTARAPCCARASTRRGGARGRRRTSGGRTSEALVRSCALAPADEAFFEGGGAGRPLSGRAIMRTLARRAHDRGHGGGASVGRAHLCEALGFRCGRGWGCGKGPPRRARARRRRVPRGARARAATRRAPLRRGRPDGARGGPRRGGRAQGHALRPGCARRFAGAAAGGASWSSRAGRADATRRRTRRARRGRAARWRFSAAGATAVPGRACEPVPADRGRRRGGGVRIAVGRSRGPTVPAAQPPHRGALARATLIVEAGLPSGTFSTADEALAANRDVLVVPGAITAASSRGANRLLYQGAHARRGRRDVRGRAVLPVRELEAGAWPLRGRGGARAAGAARGGRRGLPGRRGCARQPRAPVARPRRRAARYGATSTPSLPPSCGDAEPRSWLMERLVEAELAGVVARYPDGRWGPVGKGRRRLDGHAFHVLRHRDFHV